MHRSIRWLIGAAANATRARCCRLSEFAGTAVAAAADATAEIRYPDGKLRRLSRAWLRFNCRCAACHNSATHQRSVSPADALTAARAPSRLCQSEVGVRCDWSDGHVTEFTFGQLDALLAPDEGRRRRALWGQADHPMTGDPPSSRPVPLEDFAGASGYRTVLRNLWTFGVATVTGVDATEAATEAVVRRMAPPMETLYGRMWTFTADGSRQDTAYTSAPIGVHNDTTYLHSCAGLQVFHILEQADSGGKTCLADGFQAAETLRGENARHFALLVGRPVHHHYLETGSSGSGGLAHHTRCLDTVLKLDPEADGQLYQIRYNPFDLASLNTVPQEEVSEYLEAYSHLGEILNRQESQAWLSLRPGTVIFIDNWRVLHGRSGFSGRRVMTGCYVTRDAWMSEARVHGVI